MVNRELIKMVAISTKRLEIDFKHELYDETVNTKQVEYMEILSVRGYYRKLYKNRVFATGKDFNKIREVKYILHPTFPNPIRTVSSPNKKFELIFWAWGGFEMNIEVTDIEGEIHDYKLPIRLHDLLREAKENKVPEVQYQLPQIPL